MKFELIQQASLPIKIHLFVALLAIVIGGYQLFSVKGTKIHRILGTVWIVMMLIISISSFWIKGLYNLFWGFSPIHLLSVFVITQMAAGFYYAKTHQIVKHGKTMAGTYFYGLILADIFTLTPGRLLFKVFFG